MANGRFSYVRYDQPSADLQAAFKAKFEELESMVQTHLPAGRAQALVFTGLEESYMWVGKAIRDAQVARNPESAPEQPERNNS